jgi:hypothetical protein
MKMEILKTIEFRRFDVRMICFRMVYNRRQVAVSSFIKAGAD